MSTSTLLVLAGLSVLVLAGARWGFGRQQLPPVLQPLADSGIGFIALGVLIGPQGAALITGDTLRQMAPMLVIALGWIGFLFGAHLELRLLRRYPQGLYAAGFTAAMATAALVALVVWWVLETLQVGMEVNRIPAAVAMGLCAAGTAPAGVFRFTQRTLRQADRNAMQFISATDDLPPLVLLAISSMFLPLSGAFPSHGGAWGWLALSLGLGVALGLATHWLFPKADNIRENSLILLGIVSLGAGASALLHISPIVVTVLGGAVFANLSPRKESAYGLLAQREHSLYAVFLLVAGMELLFDWGTLALITPAYVLARGLGKVLGGWMGWRLFLSKTPVSPLIGTGLLFQGGMAVAMAVGFQQASHAYLADLVASVVLASVLVNDLLAPFLARWFLTRGRPS
ncbi:MAG: cation:proton antiporter [Deltaproteobacteria bacterium]|nr:cation:proton antiporter [Deltaproteobacteria bacterium]